MSVIEFHNVSKKFTRHAGQMLLRNHLTRFFTRQKEMPFFALKHVSFSVERGESLAVIGSNGAGKSTLLGLVAGISQPDEGTVTVNGQVAALLELGSGFHPDLTGRENVRLNAALLGLSRRQTAEAFERIVEFSGIREFIDEPLRTYSTGMMMRLAFSVAINRDPEILLVDEVLAVGDAAFQAKCIEKIHEFRNAGKTLLCVSHTTHGPAVMRPGHLARPWRVDSEWPGGAMYWKHMRGGRPHLRNVRKAWPETPHRCVGQSRNCRSCCAARMLRRPGRNCWRSQAFWKRPFRTSKPARSRRSGITPSWSGGCWISKIAASCARCSGPAGSWGTGKGAWANYSCILLCIRSI